MVGSLPSADETRQALLLAARGQIARYRWTLLSAEEVAVRAFAAIDALDQPTSAKKRVLLQYSLALYHACSPHSTLNQHSIAYTDLSHYLYFTVRYAWPDDAEDMTNRALELVWKRFDYCKAPITFLAFACCQLRRAATEHLRATKREVSADGLLFAAEDPFEQHEALLDHDGCLRMILELIREAPDLQRQTIMLKFVGMLSDEAISDRLGISVSYVRVMRHRALVHLRQNQQLRERCLNAEIF